MYISFENKVVYEVIKTECVVPKKIHTPPTGGGETKLFLIIVNVLGHLKGVGEVNFQFPPWGWYGCFLE